jgi:hypothetical protein
MSHRVQKKRGKKIYFGKLTSKIPERENEQEDTCHQKAKVKRVRCRFYEDIVYDDDESYDVETLRFD